jgi:hypothetical protein
MPAAVPGQSHPIQNLYELSTIVFVPSKLAILSVERHNATIASYADIVHCMLASYIIIVNSRDKELMPSN